MYQTDALVKKVNTDRYDDRLVVKTNLIESYDQLFDFAAKHLPDKFYLEDGKIRLSLRNIIVREMIVNTLMHREYTSGFQARFVIEKDKMFVENANRAKKDGLITPENVIPYPKNPIIANFFRNIGYSDKLGSGVRKVFNYSEKYSGADPIFAESDVFRITVPLDDNFSWDAQKTNVPVNDRQRQILDYLHKGESLTSSQFAKIFSVADKTIKRDFQYLSENGLIRRIGSDKSGKWEVQ